MVFEQNIQIRAQKLNLQFQVGLKMDVFSKGRGDQVPESGLTAPAQKLGAGAMARGRGSEGE